MLFTDYIRPVFYSYFNESAGFMFAAFNDCKVTVIMPMIKADPDAIRKIQMLILVLYAKELSQNDR